MDRSCILDRDYKGLFEGLVQGVQVEMKVEAEGFRVD